MSSVGSGGCPASSEQAAPNRSSRYRQSTARPSFASGWPMLTIWSSRPRTDRSVRSPAAPSAASNHPPPTDNAKESRRNAPRNLQDNQRPTRRNRQTPRLQNRWRPLKITASQKTSQTTNSFGSRYPGGEKWFVWGRGLYGYAYNFLGFFHK